MDTNSFTANIKTEDIFQDIANVIEKRFDAANYIVERPLPVSQKVVVLIKEELGGKIMTELVGLRTKSYSYLIDYGSGDKKAKGARKGIIKRRFKFEDFKNV